MIMGEKKIKIITIGHKVVGFSDAVLQAGELYSYIRYFICMKNCIDLVVNFFLGVWEVGWGFFGRVRCKGTKKSKITLKVTHCGETKLFLLCWFFCWIFFFPLYWPSLGCLHSQLH